MELIGIKTNLVRPGEDLVEALLGGMERSGLALTDGDVLVVAESAIATAEGGVVNLSEVAPGPRARELAEKYGKDPREMELILASSDRIMGGIPGVVLTVKDGFLYPNAGIDHSNAPQATSSYSRRTPKLRRRHEEEDGGGDGEEDRGRHR